MDCFKLKKSKVPKEEDSVFKRTVNFTELHKKPFTSKKAGFTLAEILITLGVIGIVASLTIPAVLQNYRNHVAEVRLKKFYTTFNQALLRSVADNGEMENWDWSPYVDDWDTNLEKYVLPYMTIVESKNLPEFTNYNKFYFLADGSSFSTVNNIIFFPSDPKKCRNDSIQFGVCAFVFQFHNKPAEEDSRHKYISRKGLDPYKYCWDGTEANLYHNECDNDSNYGCDSNQRGYFCTALIQYNGWKIPKNYPRRLKL